MFFNSGYNPNIYKNWMETYNNHPQGDLLKKHVERSVQDIFYYSLKEESDELFYFFSSEDQIDEFMTKLISYWEGIEEYEKCSDIKNWGDRFTSAWREKEESGELRENRVKRWIVST